jgi:hypothetical protein
MNLTPETLAPLAVGLGSVVAYFYPQIKSWYVDRKTVPTQPPINEINTVIQYFMAKGYAPGIDASVTTAKLLYDAIPLPTKNA